MKQNLEMYAKISMWQKIHWPEQVFVAKVWSIIGETRKLRNLFWPIFEPPPSPVINCNLRGFFFQNGFSFPLICTMFIHFYWFCFPGQRKSTINLQVKAHFVPNLVSFNWKLMPNFQKFCGETSNPLRQAQNMFNLL